MRTTYVVVGIVLAAGIIAFLSMNGADGDSSETGTKAVGDAQAPAKGAAKKPALKRESGPTPKSVPASTAKRESKAHELITAIAEAERAGKTQRAAELNGSLRKSYWDTETARRHAAAEGRRVYASADQLRGVNRVSALDKARRLMSRGVFLPDMFGKDGRDTAERTQLIASIQAANRVVMTWSRDLPGVTRSYKIPPGMTPARIVFRKNIVQPEPLRAGPNAVLYWNQNGNLDPAKLRAGRTFMLPLEELTVQVHQSRFRLAVFIGDWFVKEWHVGVGQPGKDTPVGSFQVHSKEENPVWYAPNGKIIHPGPDNELGSRWIAIYDPVKGTLATEDGIGIHGTNKPKTVGTRCSNGCVRLLNEHVNELFWWVRTGNGGGVATKIYILP